MPNKLISLQSNDTKGTVGNIVADTLHDGGEGEGEGYNDSSHS